MTRLWDKGRSLDAGVLAFTAGDDHLLDARLVHYDIEASLAQAGMLAARGLLWASDTTAISGALRATVARRHAGRSRNDHVLAALRLYLRDAAAELERGAGAVAAALDALASRH